MTAVPNIAKLRNALPFWLSLTLLPIVVYAAITGGWALILPVAATLLVFSVLDAMIGLNLDNANPATADHHLFWYRLITWVWFPIQLALIFGLIWYVGVTNHLTTLEKIVLFFGVGQISGAVGIVYAHELMHQKNRAERWLSDLLLGTVLYSHFRSEHLLVHHRYVGTPRDAVTARFGESFHRFFPRVLRQSWLSAFRAEREMLARKGRPWWDAGNPDRKSVV